MAGLTVIEMGTLIAGPFCGQILGDFGAEVIKIEDPKAGDPMRQWGRSLPKGHSPWWPVIGRNKKSVTLNLRTPEGQAIARKLIGGADVLVALQVTTRSPMGAIAFETGGLLFDHGWLRLLGSGSMRLEGDLARWNGLGASALVEAFEGALLVAGTTCTVVITPHSAPAKA